MTNSYRVSDAHTFREVYSGIELWDRPQLTRLRDSIRKREIDVVICHAIDRLSRDPVHLGLILTEADYAGVRVEFVTETLDDSPEGQLVRFVRAYAARIEHAKITERILRGKIERARSGKIMPASRPLCGYVFTPDRTAYVENVTTAPTVRRIFEEFTAGQTLFQMAAQLTADGIPTPKGKQQWTRQSVWTILTNRAYAGYSAAFRYATRTRNAAGDKVKTVIARPDDQHIPLPDGTIPALVSWETFEAVQARLEQNKIEASRRTRNSENALLRAGFVVCGYCGTRMTVTNVKRYPQYRCGRTFGPGARCTSHSINVSILDAAVWEKAGRVLSDPTITSEEVARLRATNPTAADLGAIERQRAEMVRKRDNLIDRLAETNDADLASAVQEKLAALTEAKRRLDAEHAAILARQHAWESEAERLSDIQAQCAKVASRVQTLDYQTKRLALQWLDVQVRVFKVNHSPRYIIEGVPFTNPSQPEPDHEEREGAEKLSEASHHSC